MAIALARRSNRAHQGSGGRLKSSHRHLFIAAAKRRDSPTGKLPLGTQKSWTCGKKPRGIKRRAFSDPQTGPLLTLTDGERLTNGPIDRGQTGGGWFDSRGADQLEPDPPLARSRSFRRWCVLQGFARTVQRRDDNPQRPRRRSPFYQPAPEVVISDCSVVATTLAVGPVTSANTKATKIKRPR